MIHMIYADPICGTPILLEYLPHLKDLKQKHEEKMIWHRYTQLNTDPSMTAVDPM